MQTEEVGHPFAVAVTTAPRPGSSEYLENSRYSIKEAGFPEPVVFADHGMVIPSGVGSSWFSSSRNLGAWGNFHRAVAGLVLRHPKAPASFSKTTCVLLWGHTTGFAVSFGPTSGVEFFRSTPPSRSPG
jgi:hypothetical protein